MKKISNNIYFLLLVAGSMIWLRVDADSDSCSKSAAATTMKQKMLLPDCKSTPRIDGVLNDSAWAEASKVKLGFLNDEKNSSPEVETDVYICKDRDNLYIAFLCMEPQMSKIVEEQKNKDGSIWKDDGVELFIDPEKNGTGYYHLIINSAGVTYDAKINNLSHLQDREWDSDIKTASIKKENYWTLEAAIPLTKILPRNENMVWGINFARSRKTTSNPRLLMETISWVPLVGTFHQPEKFGSLVISNEMLIVEDYKFTPLLGKNEFLLALKNESNTDKNVQVKFKTTSEDGSFLESSDAILYNHKENTIKIPFEFNCGGKTLLEILVTDITTQKKLLSFSIPAMIDSSPGRLLLDNQLFLPDSKNELHGSIVLNLTKQSLADLHINAVVKSKNQKIVLNRENFIFRPGHSNFFSLDIGELPIGEYTFHIELADKNGNIKYSDYKNFIKLEWF